MLLMYFGVLAGNDLKLYLGIGIAVYGFCYFMVHEIFIHQRFKIFRNSNNFTFWKTLSHVKWKMLTRTVCETSTTDSKRISSTLVTAPEKLTDPTRIEFPTETVFIIDFFHRNVDDTASSRRRSLRKYRINSAGIASAAAAAANQGLRKVGNQDI